jgi:hypothetical protein
MRTKPERGLLFLLLLVVVVVVRACLSVESLTRTDYIIYAIIKYISLG